MCERFARGCQIKYPLLVGTVQHFPLGIQGGKRGKGKKEKKKIKGLNKTNGEKTFTVSDVAFHGLSSCLLGATWERGDGKGKEEQRQAG